MGQICDARWEMRNAYSVLVGQPEGNGILRRSDIY